MAGMTSTATPSLTEGRRALRSGVGMAESESGHAEVELPAGFRHALAAQALGRDFETLPAASRRRFAAWLSQAPDGVRPPRNATATDVLRAGQAPPASAPVA